MPTPYKAVHFLHDNAGMVRIEESNGASLSSDNVQDRHIRTINYWKMKLRKITHLLTSTIEFEGYGFFERGPRPLAMREVADVYFGLESFLGPSTTSSELFVSVKLSLSALNPGHGDPWADPTQGAPKFRMQRAKRRSKQANWQPRAPCDPATPVPIPPNEPRPPVWAWYYPRPGAASGCKYERQRTRLCPHLPFH